MNEQSDDQGGAAAGGSGGELRRDRRRLRESTPESTDAAPPPASTSDGDAAPDTGGLSAFEALGFEPRSFEPREPELPPVDTARFRETTGPSDAQAPVGTPSPRSGAATPPLVPPLVPPSAEPDRPAPAPAFDPAAPPPLAEPPRREVPQVRHAFTGDLAAGLFGPGTVVPGSGEPGSVQPDVTAPGMGEPVSSGGRSDSTAPTRAQFEAQPGAVQAFSPARDEAPAADRAGDVATQAFSHTAADPSAADASSAGFTAGFSDRTTRDASPGPGAPAGHPVLGPLAPRPVEVPREVKILDVAAIVLAFVIPPVGFVVGLVALHRGRSLRGWASGVARAAVWVSVVMTVVFAAVGTWLWFEHQERVEAQRTADAAAAAQAAVVAESAEFCAAVAAVPSLFAADDPDFGWPREDDPAGYVPAIANYAAIWQGLVPVAPSGITEQVQSFSGRVDGIVTVASSLPNSNRPGDLLDLHSQPDIAAVDAYVEEYCAAVPAE